jgi:hypothetical protein
MLLSASRGQSSRRANENKRETERTTTLARVRGVAGKIGSDPFAVHIAQALLQERSDRKYSENALLAANRSCPSRRPYSLGEMEDVRWDGN